MSTTDIMIYGAYGFTGELVARLAKDRGLTPILAGRNAAKTQAIADTLGCEARAFSLDDPAAVKNALTDVTVVIHCAGPFSATSKPMADGCLATGTHYLDITGEVDVFAALADRDAEAKKAGVMLLPGAGFDVVPTDCLAAHLAGKIDDPTHLTLAFRSVGGQSSRGTTNSLVESLPKGSKVRKNGKLVGSYPGGKTKKVDFGRGPVRTMGIPWGDLVTAYHSTGIPNIEVYTLVPTGALWGARFSGLIRPLLGLGPVQRFLKRRVAKMPAGPDETKRETAKSLIWGEVKNAAGDRAEARLTTCEGYTLTAHGALDIALRVVGGEAPPGFQTPSKAYGADFVMTLPGVTRADVFLGA
ncbi:MAG: short subunit dehydrogenase-like uncharacterized protein [Myxococcota bacterium]|jgi:short subunit dehydrogenase-like uncharacterized protein